MRFLADQNVEGPIVARLRGAGHDVLLLGEKLPVRAPDHEVLRQARQEERVLITNDKDFGELIFLQQKAAAGVVLLRMPSFASAQKAERLLEVLNQFGGSMSGLMLVVSERATRRRMLPSLP